MGKRGWRRNLPTWHHRQLFWRWCVSLVKFSYWSKFHVNIMTGSGVMTIFVYKELIRNPEIGIPLSNFCSISVNCGELGIPNLARMSLIKSYWIILQNARVTAFTISELLRENQQGDEITVPPPKLGLRDQQEYTIRTISQSTEVLSL